MTTELMSPELSTSRTESKSPRRVVDPSVHEIIAAARAKPQKNPARGAWLLSATSAVLMWASFTPLDWGFLGWIALVPVILLIRAERPTRWMYTALYLSGLVCNLAMLQWMRLGHPVMYGGLLALSVYLAFYWPLFVALGRAAVHRWNVPLTLAVPVLWVGIEYLRAMLMTGFPWYFLSHTQYRWLELIQISDVTGAYGVSFLIAMTSACLAGLIPERWLKSLGRNVAIVGPNPSTDSSVATQQFLANGDEEAARVGLRRRQMISLAGSLGLFAVMLAYGYVRRGQADFRDGPRTALIQGNFTSSLKHDPTAAQRIFNMHHKLTGMAVDPYRPDLIVWPETMYRVPLLVASPDLTDEELTRAVPQISPETWRNSGVPAALRHMSEQAGAGLILGIDTIEARKDGGYRHYNSAVFVKPEAGVAGRYDKLHRVLFGEYIPLKDELPWLHKLTPFPKDFGIAAGESMAVFEHKGWRFAPIICFEDTVPHLVRSIVKNGNGADGKKVDCLVNLTNDGWFHGSSELDQHLITAAFRAVECRTPMVRAVNTGISAVIDGDGAIVEPDHFLDGDEKGRTATRDPESGRWHKQLNAVVIDDVPLDNRTSLYVAWGDWFAGLCLFATLAVVLGGLVPRKVQSTK